jgi:hypothetical protein
MRVSFVRLSDDEVIKQKVSRKAPLRGMDCGESHWNHPRVTCAGPQKLSSLLCEKNAGRMADGREA